MLGLAAVNTGNNLLYLMVAVLLGLLVISGLLGRANLSGIGARLNLPDEIYAGMPTTATLTLKNRRRRLWLFLLRARLETHQACFALIAPREAEDMPLAVQFAARGHGRIAGLRLSSTFPMGFFERSLYLPLEQEVLVLPRPLACAAPLVSEAHRPQGHSSLSRRGEEGDLLALADYSGREPLRLIHWKQSARHDSIKVKQLASLGARPLWVRLEDCPGLTTEERLGNAVYLINLLWRGGRPIGLHLGERILPPGRDRRHRLRLLRELALYDAP